MKIIYTDKKPVIKDLNRVFDSVGWGERNEKIMKEALEYQGKNIGTNIMKCLLKQIEEYKKINPNIRTYLGASKGREEFYKKFGFVSRPNDELGAGMILKK